MPLCGPASLREVLLLPSEDAGAEGLARVGAASGGELVQVGDGAVQFGVERVVLAELAQRPIAALHAAGSHGPRRARRLELRGGGVELRRQAVGARDGARQLGAR